MKVVRRKIRIDHSGKINLNIDSGLSDCEVDVLLVIDQTETKPKPKQYDFSDIAGKLTSFNEDPLEYQKRIRDEWE